VPEGDTVYLAARRLRAAMAGDRLTSSDFRVPRYATVDLSGRQVLDVVPRGKHLLTRFEGDLTLHTHFEMDGSWHLVAAGTPWPRTAGATHQVRVALRTLRWQAVGYRIPVIDLDRTSTEAQWVGHLGPDVLGPDWDAAAVVDNLTREPERQVGMALLDQRNLAGPGNLYRTEALFLHRTSPWATVGATEDLPGLVERTQRLMDVNKDRAEQTTTGSLRTGEDHWVFQREGRPCRRCGTRVLSTTQGEPGHELHARVTAWCPRCQPGPMPTAAELAVERRARLPPPPRYRTGPASTRRRPER